MTPTRLVGTLSFAAALTAAAAASATTLRTMNLEKLVRHADKVYRGTVLSARAGTVDVGGGRLPTVTYRIHVDESFKGAFETVKGVRIAELRMLGKPDPVRRGNLRLSPVLRDVPRLEVGETYLLMTTRPGAIGLSTTVGLGQGAFRISGKGEGEQALNAYRNANLDAAEDAARPSAAAPRSLAARARVPAAGPALYADLAARIRALTGAR